jgi:hypothetical protein
VRFVSVDDARDFSEEISRGDFTNRKTSSCIFFREIRVIESVFAITLADFSRTRRRHDGVDASARHEIARQEQTNDGWGKRR